MSNWYIGRNKQKFGPFSTVQLHQLITLGLVKSTEMVLEVGARQWVAASSLTGIISATDKLKPHGSSLEGNNPSPNPADQNRTGPTRRQTPGRAGAGPAMGPGSTISPANPSAADKWSRPRAPPPSGVTAPTPVMTTFGRLMTSGLPPG